MICSKYTVLVFLILYKASFIRPSKKIIGFLNDEIKPTQNYHCFAGAYYRKAASSADYWVGIEGTVVLPQFYPDPERLNITKPGKYLDNASIYLGGNSDSQETDIGLIWEIIRYENGSVSSDRLAYRPFMRRSAHFKTSQHALYQNAPANKSYYWYPDEIVNIRVQLVESGKLKFLVDGAGKRYEAIFEANGYQFSNKAEYKRVNAIDQVGNEGKPVQTTKAKVIGTKWLNVHLLRKIESEVSRVVMHPGRFTNMKCPGLNFISVLSFGRDSSIEYINLFGEGVF